MHIFRRLEYRPLNKIIISKNAIIENYRALCRISGLQIAPVLKSNAYGHGVSHIAQILDPLSPPFFCVDSLYEGYELLKLKIKTPILIMGYVDPENLRVKKLPFSYAAYDSDVIKAITRYQPDAGIHIFVDTGMHREGVPFEELENFFRSMPKKANIEGLMSHFAYGGVPDHPFTKRQIERFSESLELFRGWGIAPSFVHIASSSGILLSKKYGERLGNMGRAGIALYGIADKKSAIKPALRFSSTVVQIKSVKKGERIGYDFSFVAEKDMTIGVLSAGYNDGVDRRLSNGGVVSVRGINCPIVGKVSMNITTIDTSAGPDISEGDEAIIYSENEDAPNSVSNSAEICGTIPYELLVHLHPTTKRVEVE